MLDFTIGLLLGGIIGAMVAAIIQILIFGSEVPPND